MKARLGDYIKEYSVRNKGQEDIPVYSVTNSEGFCTGYFDKDVASQDRSTYKIVPRGCFAYNPSRINVGSVDWQRNLDRVIVSPLYVVFSVSPDLLPQYLYYYLKSDISLTFIRAVATGSVRDNLKFAMLQEFPIEMRTIAEQAEIVAILDRVKAICDMYRQKLHNLDTLIKARFVEMFGDPVSNPKGWPMPRIEEVVSADKNALKAGPFGSALKKEYYVESGYKIYGQEQVISGNPDYGDYYIDEERYHQLENCSVQAGDVLISLVGTYGKLLIMPQVFEPGIINPRLMKITFDKGKVNPYYFQHYFQSESLKKALADNTHGGTMDILNLGIVKNLRMPLPPIELQNSFVDFVSQVDKSKAVVQEALDKAQLLFDSLMQQYFG